jgi:murein DD-endopeptidase MepM/ murein hydrolase activator NlpD
MQLFQKKTDKEKTSAIAPDATINIVSDNSLLATASPQTTVVDGVGGGDFSIEEEDLEIYVVKPGDTAQVIADMFEVSVDTIYSANEIPKGGKLSVGDVLLILPFSGVEHTVLKGETPQSIATKYKVDLKDILSVNDLDTEDKISVGEKLMIPGGNIASEAKPKTVAKTGTIKGKVVSSLPSVSGYFKNPLPGAVRTRGIKPGHRGVDLAAPTGTPIYAAASGTAIIARMGYNGGFGNYVVIQHGNGTKTLYAHMSKLGTTPGAKVSQGQVIGYVGNTGNSRGAHLHIEVLGGKNPF